MVKKDEATDDDVIINLGGTTTAKLDAGDRIVVHTPGGAGWGRTVDKCQ